MRRVLLQRRRPRQPIDESKSEYLHYRDKDVASNTLGEKHYFEGLGIQPIKKTRRTLLVRRPTGVELPSEANGLVPDPEWLARTYQEPGGRSGHHQRSISREFC